MVPMQRRGIDVSREREKKMPPSSHSQLNSHHRYQLLEPLHGAGFSTMPLTHHTMGAGVAASSFSPSSMVWPLPWDGVIVAFSELTSDFLLPVKQYLTDHNSSHTGPFEDVDSTISMISLSLRHEPIWFGMDPVELTDFSKSPWIHEAWESPKPSRRIF